MNNLSQNIKTGLKTLKPYTCARQTSATGILLDANENPYGKFNRYPDPYASELKKTYSKYISTPAKNIFIGNGSDEAIDLIIRAFCEPDKDEIITLEPTYGMYRVSAEINSVKAIPVLLNNQFQIDTNKALSAVTKNTKLIFICSPNNPTGNLLKKKDILKLCADFPGIVVLDEAYIEFAKRGTMALKANNLVVLRTLSKAWGAAALRVGFAIGSTIIIETLNKIKPSYNVNTLSQKAAVAIIKKGLRVNTILKERERLNARIQNLGLKVFPSDANFILFRVPNATEIQKKLQQKGITVRDRSDLRQLKNCLRVTIGAPQENTKFLTALERLINAR